MSPESGSAGEFGRLVAAAAQQAGEWHDHPDPVRLRPLDQLWRDPWHQLRGRVDRFPDRLTLRIEGLSVGAEEFTGVGVDVFDFQPVGVVRFYRRALLIVGLLTLVAGLVEGEPAEQQVG
jgi:hypothetical protein